MRRLMEPLIECDLARAQRGAVAAEPAAAWSAAR